MDSTVQSMSELEKELATIETSALEEEKQNATYNYKFIENEIEQNKKAMPYPGVGPFDTDNDPNTWADLQYKKGKNKPYWDKEKDLKEYFDNPRLYQGHVCINDLHDYYIANDNKCPVNQPQRHELGNNVLLFNVNDAAYQHIVKAWRFPQNNKDVSFSRNIYMEDKQVVRVDIVGAKDVDASYITDKFLHKALLKNKNVPGMRDIIQTIQEKQLTLGTFREIVIS